MGKNYPYDYEVEWIGRNDKSQYIDTGVKLNYKSCYEVTIPEYTYGSGYGSQTTMGGIIGSRDGVFTNETYIVALDNGNGAPFIRFAFGNNQQLELYENSYPYVGKKIVLKLYGNKVYINGTLIRTLTNQTFSASVNASLFAMNDNNTVRNGFGRNHLLPISSCKIWDENGKEIRDFIPVVKDGVGYMYDKVECKLYGNLGDGQFTIGTKI